MNRIKEVWLDLEGTLINSWDDTTPLHIGRIKTYLDNINYTNFVNLFSFAIWDDRDRKELVDNGIIKMIEIGLNRTIYHIPTVEEMIDLISLSNPTYRENSYTDFIQTNGKMFGFMRFIKAIRMEKYDNILIDDMIEQSVYMPEDKGMIQFIDVNKLQHIVKYNKSE